MISCLFAHALALSSARVGGALIVIALIVLALFIASMTRRRQVPRPAREGEDDAAFEAQYHVPGMACQNCAQSIDAALRTIPGVLSVKSKLRHKRVHVRYVPAQVHEREIREALGRAGYDAEKLEIPRSENKST